MRAGDAFSHSLRPQRPFSSPAGAGGPEALLERGQTESDQTLSQRMFSAKQTPYPPTLSRLRRDRLARGGNAENSPGHEGTVGGDQQGRLIRQIVQEPILLLIRAYQYGLSPVLGPHCRFTPTCSQYCYEAVQRFGPWKGLFLGGKRLLRCHPFHPGGYDPVIPDGPKS